MGRDLLDRTSYADYILDWVDRVHRVFSQQRDGSKVVGCLYKYSGMARGGISSLLAGEYYSQNGGDWSSGVISNQNKAPRKTPPKPA
jgi:hypothetical protein